MIMVPVPIAVKNCGINTVESCLVKKNTGTESLFY